MNRTRGYLVIVYSVLLTISLTGCQDVPVKITDLQWGNPTKEWIARNKVDSTFLISRNRILNLGLSDTVGLIVYDAAGNVLYERYTQIFGNTTYYRYDSNNLLSMKRFVTDYVDETGFRYRFYPESMVVDEVSFDYGYPDSVRQMIRHRFNKKGWLIASEGLGDEYRIKYQYDASGNLISIGAGASSRSDSSTTHYYYTRNLPDSMILTDYRKLKPYVTRIYFDTRGLVTRKVMWDSIVTRYLYHFRE